MLNRLWQKLFLAFAVLSVATLLSLYLLQQRAFQRDFLDYVNRIGLERLEQASVRLGKRYEEVGNWNFLLRQARLFNNFLDGGETLPGRGPPGERDERSDFRDRPPPGERLGPPRDGRPPRPQDQPSNDRRPFDRPPNDGPPAGGPDFRDDRRPPPGTEPPELRQPPSAKWTLSISRLEYCC